MFVNYCIGFDIPEDVCITGITKSLAIIRGTPLPATFDILQTLPQDAPNCIRKFTRECGKIHVITSSPHVVSALADMFPECAFVHLHPKHVGDFFPEFAQVRRHFAPEPNTPGSPNEIIPNLYLGSEMSATLDRIHALNIGAVLNVTETIPCASEECANMRIPIMDESRADVSQWFGPAHEFINKNLGAGKKVLVHCGAGISRSATIVISYIMRELGKTVEEALAMVREKRPKVDPNIGFSCQLVAYEKMLHII